MPNENDTNIIVDGQRAVATIAQSGTVVQDGGAIDATSVIQTDSGLQKVVKVMDVNGGGGGGGTQNIKAYHAPSASLDATLLVPIPNVDACTEQGLYNVDYSFTSDDGTMTSNAILEVSDVSVNGVSAITQNLLINVGAGFVYCTRNYINNTFTSWEGKNIPVELAKCLQNKATGDGSLAISLDNNTLSNSGTVIVSPQISNPSLLGNNQTIIGTSASGGGNSRVICIGNYARGYGDDTIVIGNSASSALTRGVSIGHFSSTRSGVVLGNRANSFTNGIAIGSGADTQNYVQSSGSRSIAIGTVTDGTTPCKATANYAIQLGNGTNAVANQFQVYTYPMLDGNTGKIPNERLRITVADTTNTSATIANVEGGKDYTFTNALTALTITAITASFVEANIYFTADTGITVTLPQGTSTIGDFTFTAGKSYVISIQNGIAVRGELN